MSRWWIVVLALALAMGCSKGKKKRGGGGEDDDDEASKSERSSKRDRGSSGDEEEYEEDEGREVTASSKRKERKRTKRSGGEAPEWLVPIAEKVPADVEVVAGANVSSFFDWWLSGGIIPMKAFKNMDGLRKDLGALSSRHIGFNVLNAEYFAVFKVAAGDKPIMALTGDWSSFHPKGKAVTMDGRTTHQLEGDMYVMKDGDVLWLSDPNGLTMVTAVSDGKKPSLAGSDMMGDLAFSVSNAVDGEATMFVYIGVAEPLEEMLSEFGAPGGISLDSLAAGSNEDGDLGLGVYGDALSIDQLYSMLKMARSQGQMMLNQLYEAGRMSDDMNEALQAIMAYHLGNAALKTVKTNKVKGGIVVQVALGVPEVGMLGGLAVVGIPAFIKYMRRAKTTEAIDELDKIYKSSSHYYTAPRVARGTGMKIPCQFPADQAMTPDVTGKKCCGGVNDADNDDRCDVKTGQWTTATWSALNFQMNDQHYFGYSYQSSGTGASAKFTATANADLDCDGILSTFQRFGYGDDSASMAECSMKGSSAFYKHNETE